MTSPLSDQHGRTMRKLRIQLTDACNFRCFYCMPEHPKFTPKKNLLTADEIIGIATSLTHFGLKEVRLTGGEPTLRTDFLKIVQGLSQLDVDKLALTTNAFRLEELLPQLRDTNLTAINISLDSLREDRFNEYTRTSFFPKVLRSILLAKEMGFAVKINTLLFKGRNTDEIMDFVEWSEQTGIEVRFLEYMDIGPRSKTRESLYISAEETINIIKQHRQLEKVSLPKDSTAFSYTTEKKGIIGFIASESQPFCHSCSRLRLTATGKLRACLFSEAGENLKGIPVEQYDAVISRVIGMKPTHRIKHIEQPMHEIGG